MSAGRGRADSGPTSVNNLSASRHRSEFGMVSANRFRLKYEMPTSGHFSSTKFGPISEKSIRAECGIIAACRSE